MRKLTKNQRVALSMIQEGAVSGVCIRYMWHFRHGNEHLTREVKSLQKKGLISVSYYRDGAGVNLTDDGREALWA